MIRLFLTAVFAALSMAQEGESPISIPENWNPVKDRTFVGKALYGYMNGGSDEYYEYGFQCLRVVTLVSGGFEYTVEIFRMDGAENAFGIYSQHTFKPLRTDALPEADHDCLSKYQLQAVKGGDYISIVFENGLEASSGADKILAEYLLFLQAAGEEGVPHQ